MANSKNNFDKDKAGMAVAAAAGVATIGAIGYLLFGPNGKKNQKAVKSWALKMKADVIEKLEEVEEVTGPMYDKIVAEVEDKYKKLKNVSSEDLAAEVDSLKKNWSQIVKKAGSKKSTAKKTVKKLADKLESEVDNAEKKVKRVAKKAGKKVEDKLD